VYETERPLVTLSVECWECLDVFLDVMYTTSYAVFLTDHIKLAQKIIRSMAPNIRGDWLRFRYEGKTLTFSVCDDAIQHYRPRMQEFVSFGAAVRMLGAYESYMRKVGEHAVQVMPEAVDAFEAAHKCGPGPDRFTGSNVGRGIDLLAEIFGFRPHPSYRPSLGFFYELRNVGVHNASIADERLCNAAKSGYIHVKGMLKVGAPVPWSLSACVQLHHLLTELLQDADPFVWRALGMRTLQKQAYWYLDKDTPGKDGG